MPLDRLQTVGITPGDACHRIAGYFPILVDLERLFGGQGLPFHQTRPDCTDHQTDRPTRCQLEHPDRGSIPLLLGSNGCVFCIPEVFCPWLAFRLGKRLTS